MMKKVTLLKRKFELHMRVHNSQVFIQDGSPCHGNKVVKKFLEQKSI